MKQLLARVSLSVNLCERDGSQTFEILCQCLPKSKIMCDLAVITMLFICYDRTVIVLCNDCLEDVALLKFNCVNRQYHRKRRYNAMKCPLLSGLKSSKLRYDNENNCVRATKDRFSYIEHVI